VINDLIRVLVKHIRSKFLFCDAEQPNEIIILEPNERTEAEKVREQNDSLLASNVMADQIRLNFLLKLVRALTRCRVQATPSSL